MVNCIGHGCDHGSSGSVVVLVVVLVLLVVPVVGCWCFFAVVVIADFIPLRAPVFCLPLRRQTECNKHTLVTFGFM